MYSHISDLSRIGRGRLLLCLFFWLAWAGGVLAEDTNALGVSPEHLKKLSLEELMNLDVTSVSRKEERITATAAAIHVITQEDIRRSGARSIPEALRLAPNLHVAQVTSKDWAISARGFNGTAAANKLLVMIDGRAVYTPLFSGVFWDVQDYLLEDLDRIEVISGPGGTLWGANAVNGVINIITREAKNTQGFLGTIGGGTEERGFGSLRYGGQLAENVYYRVYAKYFDRDSLVFPNGDDAEDDWRMGQGGFRIDWDVSDRSLLTFQGDVYDGRANQLLNDHMVLRGGNALTRLTHAISEDSDLQLQVYYDRTHREMPGVITDDLDTFDIDSQYRFPLGERQEIVTGLGYRYTHNRVDNTPAIGFLPTELDRHLFSAFVQDDIVLIEEHLKLTLGSKFEHNDWTGFEVQPSIRMVWTNHRHVVWGAVSRAVRTPSRIDRDLFIPETPPYLIAGGPGFDSEELLSYELGYRVQPFERAFFRVSTFYNEYDNLRSVVPGPPFTIANDLEGETYGAELEVTFEATDWWRLIAGYTLFEDNIRVQSGRVDLNRARAENNDPEQRFVIRSAMDLPKGFELDLTLRYVDQLSVIQSGFVGTVPSYLELDARLGWRLSENFEVSIVGQNLLDQQHPEFGFPSAMRREVERGVYGKLTWRF